VLVPSVQFIEAALDTIKHDPDVAALHNDQIDELESLGAARAQSAGASGLTDDFRAGYLLGLATARVILQGSPLLRLKGIDPGEVL